METAQDIINNADTRKEGYELRRISMVLPMYYKSQRVIVRYLKFLSCPKSKKIIIDNTKSEGNK